MQEVIIGCFQNSGARLISIAEPDLLHDEPTRRLMRQLMGALAAWEAAMSSSGNKRRAGVVFGKSRPGPMPYGSVQGEQIVVERMKVLRTLGLGFDRIAPCLNSEGFKQRRVDAGTDLRLIGSSPVDLA